MLGKGIISISIVFSLLIGSLIIVDTVDNRIDPEKESQVSNSEYSLPVRSTSNNETIWPMFQYDLQNTGRNPNAIRDNPGLLRWKTRIKGSIISSSPTLYNKIILIGSSVSETNRVDKGLYVLNGIGNYIWNQNLNGWVESSPIIFKDKIIATCRDNSIYSFNLNGSLSWKYTTGGNLYGSPVVFDDKITFGSANHVLYSLYPNGSLYWKINIGATIYSTPAIDDNGIIYITGREKGTVVALYSNGTVKWKRTLNSTIDSSPTIGNGGILYTNADDYLYSIYPNNGTVRWRYLALGYNTASPAIDQNGNILFGTGNGYFYSLDSDGNLNWRYRIGRDPYGGNPSIRGSPAIDGNGIIYFGGRDTYVYSFYPNGTKKWVYKTGDVIHSSPAIDNFGNVYIGSMDGYLYSIGFPLPEPPNSLRNKTGFGFVNLSWNRTPNFEETESEGYRVYRNDTNGSFERIAEVDPGSRFYNDTDVVNGVNYTYYIVAYNFEGDGKRSPYVQVTPKGRSLPPSNIEAIPGPDYILLDWDPPIDSGGFPVLRYNVYKRNQQKEFVFVTNTTDTFYNDTGLEAPGERGYKLSAVTILGEGRLSDVIPGLLRGPPSAPLNFNVRGGDGFALLSWDPPDFTGGLTLINYTIYRNGSEFVNVDGNKSQFNDTEVTNGVEYVYRISVSNEMGDGEKTGNITVIPSGFPDPPSGVVASLGQDHVEISWSYPIDDGGLDVQEYRIYKLIDSDWTRITSTTKLRYTDDDIENGKVYSYRLSSVNGRGEGPLGSMVEIEIPEGDIPLSPQDFSISLEKNGVLLTWAPPSDPGDSEVTGYIVYRRSGVEESWGKLAETSGMNYTDSDVDGNVTYFYIVSAVNEYGEGIKSDQRSIVIPEDFVPSENGEVPPDDGEDDNPILIIIAVAAGLLFIIVVIVILLFIVVKGKKKGSPSLEEDVPGQDIESEILGDIGSTEIVGSIDQQYGGE